MTGEEVTLGKVGFTVTVDLGGGQQPQSYAFLTEKLADEFIENLRQRYGNQVPVKKVKT